MAAERAAYFCPVVPRVTPGLLHQVLCRKPLPDCCADGYYWLGVPKAIPGLCAENCARSYSVVPRMVPEATHGLLCRELCKELLMVCCSERYSRIV